MTTGPLSSLAFEVYRDALAHAVLDRKAERKLLTLALAGDEAALNTLVAHNQRLIYREALRVENMGLAGELELLDLIQYGNLGLLKAIRKFDLSRDNKLSTYAVPWIRVEIERGARGKGQPLDPGINKSVHQAHVRRAAVGFYQTTEHWPTPAELVEATGLSLAIVLDALTYEKLSFLSLKITTGDGPGSDPGIPIEETIPDLEAPDPETEATANLEHATLQAAVATLPPPLRDVLEMRYGLNGYQHPHNYRAIGQALGFSRTWAQKLETDALLTLKKACNIGDASP